MAGLVVLQLVLVCRHGPGDQVAVEIARLDEVYACRWVDSRCTELDTYRVRFGSIELCNAKSVKDRPELHPFHRLEQHVDSRRMLRVLRAPQQHMSVTYPSLPKPEAT